MTDDRVTELELKFTAQEHLLHELSEVLWKQQRQLDALTARLEQLARRLESTDAGQVDPTNERPPHY